MNINIDNKINNNQKYFHYNKSKISTMNNVSFASKIPEDDDGVFKVVFEAFAGFLVYDIAKPLVKKACNALKSASETGNIDGKIQSTVSKGVTRVTEKIKPKTSRAIPVTNTSPTQEGAERIAGILSGKTSSEALARGAREANEQSQEILKLRQKFPELLANREERRIKFLGNKEKFKQGLLDLGYYKDEFRINVTVPAERLKILRESSNPELKQMFDLDRKMFQINDGTMIHGQNNAEKKKMLDALIEDAKKHDMDVVHIKAGDVNPLLVSQQVERLFPEAKQKFLTQKKHTVFVIENADKILSLDDISGPCRGSINVHTNNCGSEGITWISTVNDISKLDSSCYRGGRVTSLINIDDAVKLRSK